MRRPDHGEGRDKDAGKARHQCLQPCQSVLEIDAGVTVPALPCAILDLRRTQGGTRARGMVVLASGSAAGRLRGHLADVRAWSLLYFPDLRTQCASRAATSQGHAGCP